MKLNSTHFMLLGLAMLTVIFAYKGVIDAREAMKKRPVYIELKMSTPEEINKGAKQ